MRRMRLRAGLFLFATTMLLPACEVSAGDPDDADAVAGTRAMLPSAEADAAAQAVRDRVIQVFRTGAAAATGMPEVYTPDAVLSDEMEQTYSGQAAIRTAFSQGVPPGSLLDIRSFGAIGSGDLVVDMGTYTFTMPQPGGAPEQMNGRYLVALQRLDDGNWKIVRQITDMVGAGGAMAVPAASSAARDSTPPDSAR